MAEVPQAVSYERAQMRGLAWSFGAMNLLPWLALLAFFLLVPADDLADEAEQTGSHPPPNPMLAVLLIAGPLMIPGSVVGLVITGVALRRLRKGPEPVPPSWLQTARMLLFLGTIGILLAGLGIIPAIIGWFMVARALLKLPKSPVASLAA